MVCVGGFWCGFGWCLLVVGFGVVASFGFWVCLVFVVWGLGCAVWVGVWLGLRVVWVGLGIVLVWVGFVFGVLVVLHVCVGWLFCGFGR